jgi:hypothetical protein
MYTDRLPHGCCSGQRQTSCVRLSFSFVFYEKNMGTEQRNGTGTREKERQFGIFTGETFMHGIGLAS